MIKFFRRLRQKLVVQGNLRKYLLYAIGEILLVMIGILLALQVNNWNENRKIKMAESKILIDLKDEFIRNHTDLMRIFNAKKDAEKELRNYLNILTNDTLEIPQKAIIRRPNMAGITWDPSYPILNSLMGTGRVDYIQNDSLKYLLTSWNERVMSYIENQSEYSQKDIRAIDDFETSRIPIPVFVYKKGQSTRNYMTPFDIIKLREKVVMDITYHNLIGSCISRLNVQILTATGVLSLSNRIQVFLEEEIMKNGFNDK